MARPHSLLPLALLVLGACADPRGEFEAFTKRKVAPTELCGPAPACTPAPASQLEGQFYFVIAPTPVDKLVPIVFSAEVTATDSPRALAMVVTPLLASDRATPITAEAGSTALDLGSFPIDDEGYYEAALPLLRVPGAANPLTGRDIAAQVTLSARFCQAEDGGTALGPPDFYAGNVEGDVTEPLLLSLAGSFFTLERMVGGAIPDPIHVDCTGTPAGPIPEPQ